ncbi:MAG: TPM domain-containing protein [Bacteroidales bacterium]|nr:TPM domain-containing protein [Bacteroidales bacterium]
MSVKHFFSEKEQNELLQAIQDAELNTSGEVRVHLENSCRGSSVERAKVLFHQLKMDQTAQRNGVLFYLAVNSRKFAIIGDEGIHKMVGDDFWNEIRNAMLEQFHNNQFKEGLVKGIELTGEKLRKFFPYQTDDVNELPDDISFTEN